MLWPVINCALIILVAFIGLYQYVIITRRYYFDKAICGLRAIKNDAIIKLLDETNKTDNRQSIIELRQLISISGLTLDFFEKIKSKRLSPKVFKKIFLKIDEGFRATNKSFIKPTPAVEEFIPRYCAVLLTALSTGIFFRYRFLTNLILFLIGILVKLGVGRLTNMGKIQHVAQTYSDMKDSAHSQPPCTC